jgi:tRNA pseudouridine38-40 synthase
MKMTSLCAWAVRRSCVSAARSTAAAGSTLNGQTRHFSNREPRGNPRERGERSGWYAGGRNDNAATTEVDPNKTPRMKKSKVAIVLGYKGSAYHGNQYNKIQGCITVEEVLENALFEIGCISESNHGDIKKIGWSRSSRTDKGVHAARVVVGVKLQFDSEWITEDFRVPEVVSRLNAVLPADVQAFSCFRVTNSFRARLLCNWR